MADQNLIDWEFCFSWGMQATTPNTTNGRRSYITQMTTQNNEFQGKTDDDIDYKCISRVLQYCKHSEPFIDLYNEKLNIIDEMTKLVEDVFLKRIIDMNNSNILTTIYYQIHLYWNISCVLQGLETINDNNIEVASNIKIISALLETVTDNCMIAKPYANTNKSRYILPEFTEGIDLDKSYSILSMYRNLTAFEHTILSKNVSEKINFFNIGFSQDGIKGWLTAYDSSRIPLSEAIESISSLSQKNGYDYVSSDNLWKQYPFVNHSIAEVAKEMDILVYTASIRNAGERTDHFMTN